MGRHRNKKGGHTGITVTLRDDDESSPNSQQNIQQTQPSQTVTESGSTLFVRVRQEQKRIAEERAAVEKAKAENLSRFHQQLTALDEAQPNERNALMSQELTEREALQQKMRQVSSELTTQQRIAERNQGATAELHRRREAAAIKRTGGLFSFSTPQSPTFDFDVVKRDDAQQPAVPKPTRWW